ncbi:lectin-like protein, partial [Salmonella sp. s51944]|uniref:lectin-like protein n=1 Tax=Salmonella sp. s51944 TaxID=3159655 RepID=UPI00397E9573
ATGLLPWGDKVSSVIYIGLNDKDRDGTYEWSDGTEFDYNNWSPRQGSGGLESGVLIWEWPGKEGEWNDVNEKTKKIISCFMCEK